MGLSMGLGGPCVLQGLSWGLGAVLGLLLPELCLGQGQQCPAGGQERIPMGFPWEGVLGLPLTFPWEWCPWGSLWAPVSSVGVLVSDVWGPLSPGFLSQRWQGQLSLIPRGCGQGPCAHGTPVLGGPCALGSLSQGCVGLGCSGGRCPETWGVSPRSSTEAGPRR